MDYELMLAFSVFLWIIVVFAYLKSGLATVYHPATVYIFFHGLVFVLRPIVVFYLDYKYIYNEFFFVPDMATKNTTLLAVNLGFIVFISSVLYFGNTKFRISQLPEQTYKEHRAYKKQLLLAAAIMAPLGIYSTMSLLKASTNDFNGMVTDAATGLAVNTTSNGYIYTAGDLLAASTVLLAWQYRFRLLAIVPFGLFFLARASSGSRWGFLLPAIALGLFWLYDKRRAWPTPRILMGGLAALGLFFIIGQQRELVRSWITGKPVEGQLVHERFLEGEDFANLEMTEHIIAVVPQRSQTYEYFIGNLQVLTEPIPRALWNNKPIGPPIQRINLPNYGFFYGTTRSMVGEGWMQLGYVGVILWCTLWGFVLGKFYNWFARNNRSPFVVATYLTVLPMTVQVFRDGVLLSALKFPLWFLVTVGVWMMLKRLSRPAPMRRGRSPTGQL